MSVKSGAESTPSKAKKPKGRVFIWLLLLMALILGFGYFTYLNIKDETSNADFYRVLYEASNTFNENLSKIASLHEFKESETSIRSLFPSYRRTSAMPLGEKHTVFRYQLVGQKIIISSQADELSHKTADLPSQPAGANDQPGAVVSNIGLKPTITQDQNEMSQSSAAQVDILITLRDNENTVNQQSLKLSPGRIGLTPDTPAQKAADVIVPSATDTEKGDTGPFAAQLNLKDVLPEPEYGFSQFIFANDKGKVLAPSGSEKTISIIDLTSINQEFMRQAKQSLLALPENVGNSSAPPPLPSYSSHIDMQLSYGDFRVYVFPFPLTTALTVKGTGEEPQATVLERVYLIGLLPKQNLAAKRTDHWNLSVLMVSLVSLVFMWALVRLYLLPKTHSITRLYRNITHISSYAFFIVLIAMLLAYLQHQVMQHNKDRAAKHYAQQLSRGLNDDLAKVFKQLQGYRSFYQILITRLESSAQSIEQSNTQRKDNWLAGSAYTRLADKDPNISFNQRLIEALSSSVPIGCTDTQVNAGLLPKYAASQNKLYAIVYTCGQDSQKNARWQPLLPFGRDAENVIKNAYQTNQENIDTLDFYAGNLKINIKPKDYVETYIDATEEPYLPSVLLNVFALNGQGNSVLPSFYFLENNAFPTTFNLSHRDYYKNIRDQQGWDINLGQGQQPYSVKDVYIQRLLNINNGTRGTTISMPLYDDSAGVNNIVNGHVLAADVLLPTVSLAPPAPYDFTYMLVDRDNGNVLFHSDESRSLVENLYFSGNSQSHLSQWIKAGLDYTPDLDGDNIISDSYHGEPGRFIMHPSAVDQWAILVFYPDDSLDSLMTSQFIFITVSLALVLTLLAIFSFLLGYWFNTDALKKICNLPGTFDSREMLHMCSILLAIIYALHGLAQLLRYAAGDNQYADLYPDILPLGALVIMFYFGYKGYQQLFEAAGENFQTNHMGRNGAIVMACGLALLAIVQLGYLRTVMDMPLKNLGFYYQQQYCNRVNREVQELNDTGLSRYPNSITQQRIAATDLLPLDENWRAQLVDRDEICPQHSRAVEPKDYPSLSSLVGATYGWQWINTYLFNPDYLAAIAIPHTVYDPLNRQVTRVNADPARPENTYLAGFQLPLTSVIWIMLTLAILIWIWLHFNRHILWYRLYCSQFFLKYIKQLCDSQNSIVATELNNKLRIEVEPVKPNGLGLTFLLRNMANAHESDTSGQSMLAGFDKLFALSPFLQRLQTNNLELANLKLNLVQASDGSLLEVELWDLEVCLELPELRGVLLTLIMELKSLTLAGYIGRLTIFSGFYSLQRVEMKDPLATGEDSAKLMRADYLSWSDCLLDFAVVLPVGLSQGLDHKMLAAEISAFPELAFLTHSLDKLGPKSAVALNAKPIKRSRWATIRRQHEWQKPAERWATINFILLHGSALFRFKWESCSNAEKLALYNLAKKQRLNPTNTQMIEQLALNGLIKVEQRHIRIISNSFAHFILHAESPEELSQLVSDGEAGTWKNYRLPVGILILLIIGGIALTSGKSVYIIAASLAGVIGTIASVTSSANLLKSQLKD